MRMALPDARHGGTDGRDGIADYGPPPFMSGQADGWKM